MEELLRQMADLIIGAEKSGIVPQGSHYYLSPDGSRIEDDEQALIYATDEF